MKKLIDLLTKCIELFFYGLILKQRNRLIDKSIKRINKYNRKLKAEKSYLTWLTEDTQKIIDKGTYM